MDQKNVSFLPYHAINEFMRPEYRQSVIHAVITGLPNLPEKQQSAVNQMIKKMVQIPGFRNSLQAPAPLKVKPAIKTFEKNPAFVAALLSAWAELHTGLRQQVYDLLVRRDWEVLPPDADRTKLPGFLTTWPGNEDFSVLNKAFQETYPDAEVSSDDVSLMAVWLAGRLPMETSSAEEPSS